MNARPARPWRRRIALLLIGLALVGGAVFFWFRHEILPESSPYARGGRVALEAGCFACHDRSTPVANFAAGDAIATAEPGTVPGILDGDLPADELHQWIANGTSDRAAKRTREKAHLLHMPAFREHLSSSEMDDLVVHLLLQQHRAARSRETELPANASRWRRAEHLARRAGCFSCHGELGQGGVGNPKSHKGYIPGFQGVDFDLLTHDGDRALVQEWIGKGHSSTFVDEHLFSSLAESTLAGQAIHMPAYETFLTSEELQELVDYCLYLHALGPLDRAGFERYLRDVEGPAPVVQSATENRGNAESVEPTPHEVPTTIDFVAHVAPILEVRCVRCHGPEKQKSDYRLDRREDAMRGGGLAEVQERPAILVGDASGSTFIRFVEALEENEDEEIYPMPPKRDEHLEESQILVLRRWIDQGALWPEGLTLNDRAGKQSRLAPNHLEEEDHR